VAWRPRSGLAWRVQGSDLLLPIWGSLVVRIHEVLASLAPGRKSPRLLEIAGKEQRPTFGANKINAVFVVWLKHVDIAGTIFEHLTIPVGIAPLLFVSASQNQACAPSPRMRMHRFVGIRSNEVVQKHCRSRAPIPWTPSREVIAIQVRQPVAGDLVAFQ
jgi:hypothetical protein